MIKNWTKKDKQLESFPTPAISSFYPISLDTKKESLIFTFKSDNPIFVGFNLSLFDISEKEPIFVQIKVKGLDNKNQGSVEGYLNNIKINPDHKLKGSRFITAFELKVPDFIPVEGTYKATIFIKNKRQNTADRSQTFFYLRRSKDNEEENK